MVGLTDRQQRVLDFVQAFIDEHQYPPTLDEIGEALGMSAPGATYHLNVLERKGYIARDTGKARSTRIVQEPA